MPEHYKAGMRRGGGGLSGAATRIPFFGSNGAPTSSADLTFDDTTDTLTLGKSGTPNLGLIAGAADMVFDSLVADKNILYRCAGGFGAHYWRVNGGTEALRIRWEGDVIIGNGNASQSVIATNAQFGFLRLSGCAGVPTGAAVSGSLVHDTTNDKIYFRTAAGAWAALN